MLRGLYDLQYATGGEIRAIYQDLFGRAPDPEGMAYYSRLLADVPVSEAYKVIGGGAKNQDVAEITAQEIAEKSTAGIPQGLLTGYNPEIERLYETYLGREADPYAFQYESIFGPTIEANEIQDFIKNAVSSGEISREQAAARSNVESLYQTYLGRPADESGLMSYADMFGPTIEPGERAAFVRGAIQSGEITQDQGNRILESLGVNVGDTEETGETGGTGGVNTNLAGSPLANVRMGAPNPALQISRPADYGEFMGTNLGIPTSTGLRNLYRSVLGREPDPTGYNSYMEAFGPTIDPFEIQQFRAGALNELAQQAERRAFDREQFRERINQPLIAPATPIATQPKVFQPSAFDFTTNIQRPTFVAQPGLGVNFPVPAGAQTVTTSPGDLAITNLPGMRKDDPSGEDVVIDDQGDTGETGETGENDSDGKAGGLVLYAGGPVMGSPQYFAEGGEAASKLGSLPKMSKYSVKDLGSTFDISEYIDPETGVFKVNEYQRDVVFSNPLKAAEAAARASMTDKDREQDLRDLMFRQGLRGREYQYAKGGIADIARKGYAEELRQQGRYGDTVLAHINPEEAQLLSQVSGPPSINPETGLPEFFWKKLFRLASFALPFVAGPLGLSAIQTGLVGGLLGGASAKKGFSFKQGLMSGLTAFMGAKAAESLAAAGATTSGTGTFGQDLSSISPVGPQTTDAIRMPSDVLPGELGDIPIDAGGKVLLSPERISTNTISNVVPTETGTSIAYSESGRPLGEGNILPAETGDLFVKTANQPGGQGLPGDSFYDRTVKQFKNMGKGVENVFSGDKATRDAAIKAAGYAPIGYALTAPATYESMSLADMAAVEAEKRKRKRALAEASFNTYFPNIQYTGATGGLIALAKGGAIDPVGYEGGGMTAPVNQPRMLAGGGDGMSDSIPATIDGTQPARLADGEFVIPADVVADIGNGSSSAGAKRLYGMMDRVREARHGTTKQPPEIKTNRLMPA